MPARAKDVLREAVPLYAKTERRAAWKPDEPQAGRNRRERECEQMCYAERGRHREEVLELVPASFLHFPAPLSAFACNGE
jgi:hypothetical protein